MAGPIKNSDVRAFIAKMFAVGALAGAGRSAYRYYADLDKDIKKDKERTEPSPSTVVIPNIKEAAGEGWPIWALGEGAAGTAQAIIGGALAVPLGFKAVTSLYDMYRRHELDQKVKARKKEYNKVLKEILEYGKEKRAMFGVGPDTRRQKPLWGNTYDNLGGAFLAAWAASLGLTAYGTKKLLDTHYRRYARMQTVRNPLGSPRIVVKDHDKDDDKPVILAASGTRNKLLSLFDIAEEASKQKTTTPNKPPKEKKATHCPYADIRALTALETLTRDKRAGFMEGTELGVFLKQGAALDYDELLKRDDWRAISSKFVGDMTINDYFNTIG